MSRLRLGECGKLIIIRGPSGSGKSTIAESVGGDPKQTWFENDMWMTDDEGNYNWSSDAVKLAHRKTLDMISLAMEARRSPIIVTNAAAKLRTVNQYVAIAERFSYEVEVWRTPGPWDIDTLVSRNVHNVPYNTVTSQVHNYVEYPGEQEHEYSFS